jgi:hypothetical protein
MSFTQSLQHLLKTFWAGIGGWHDEQRQDGTVIWNSPNGQTYTTQPAARRCYPPCAHPPRQHPPKTEKPRQKADADRGLKMPRRRLNDDFVAERDKPPPF